MIFLWLSFLFFFLFLFSSIFINVFKKKNKLVLETDVKKNPRVAIFIPARDESLVIENLLLSIVNQTFPIVPKDVYVIVEEETDPTIQIVKKYNMSYFVRKNLHLKTKGYALQELVEYLEEQKEFYDCYFIFDADNVLHSNFILSMLEDYQKGYAVSTGYRALKNKESYFPLAAGLTFLLINAFRNQKALQYDGNIILSGTGYFIHGKYIKEWKTFPFHSLTEDYESSLYYTLHSISTHYNTKAIFYDEQPTHYKQSITQRSRWIKGYFINWFFYQKLLRKRRKEKPCNIGSCISMELGILPILFLLLSIFFLLVGLFFVSFSFFFVLLFSFYISLLVLTFFLLKEFQKKESLSKKVFWQVLFFHPIFLLSYVIAFFKSFSKKLGWSKIKHGDC